LASLVSRTFTSTGKAQSAADRVAQYHAALPDVMKHLVLGWGLAIPTTYIAVGQTVATQSPDDVYLSIVLRTGLFGLLVFAALAVTAIVVVVRVFRDHPDPKVAALAWGCGTIVVAILVRGSVEGIFEKYRLAIELGLALGMAQSAMASLVRRRPPAQSAVGIAPPSTKPPERSADQLAALGASTPQ
jgi:O-antigen ligase